MMMMINNPFVRCEESNLVCTVMELDVLVAECGVIVGTTTCCKLNMFVWGRLEAGSSCRGESMSSYSSRSPLLAPRSLPYPAWPRSLYSIYQLLGGLSSPSPTVPAFPPGPWLCPLLLLLHYPLPSEGLLSSPPWQPSIPCPPWGTFLEMPLARWRRPDHVSEQFRLQWRY